MTKYVLFVDHNTGFGKDNKKIPLEALNLLVALHESTRICEREENLFRAFLYKRVSENEYELIMKTYDGKFFCVDSRVQVQGKTCLGKNNFFIKSVGIYQA